MRKIMVKSISPLLRSALLALPLQFLFNNLEKRNMYKLKPQSSNSKIPPSVLINSSKKAIKTPLPSIHKENQLLDTNNIFKNNESSNQKQTHKLASNLQKLCEFPEPIELKLTQPVKSPHQSKRKMVRPWGAKIVDVNTETLKTDRFLASLEKSKEICHERRGSFKESVHNKGKDLEYYNSELRVNEDCTETARIMKAISTREKSESVCSRDKAGQCKIALKKSVFPISQKQYEQQRLMQHFQKEEDLMSTIHKNYEDDQEKFISIESYSKLVF